MKSLANTIESPMTKEEILKAAELDWKVMKVQSQSKPYSFESTDKNGQIITIERPSKNLDKCTIERLDNGVTLGSHGLDYSIMQPSELYELVNDFAGVANAPIVKGGYLGEGEVIMMTVKGQRFDDIKGSDIETGFTILSSFDGSASLTLALHTLDYICKNEFSKISKAAQFKFRHTKNMHIKIDELKQVFAAAKKLDNEFREQVYALAAKPIQTGMIDMVTRSLFDIKPSVKNFKIHDDKNQQEISTRKANLISQFNLDLTDQLDQKGQNLWGLFSGVTKFTTHSMNSKNQTFNKMVGQIGNRERNIYTQLLCEVM